MLWYLRMGPGPEGGGGCCWCWFWWKALKSLLMSCLLYWIFDRDLGEICNFTHVPMVTPQCFNESIDQNNIFPLFKLHQPKGVLTREFDLNVRRGFPQLYRSFHFYRRKILYLPITYTSLKFHCWCSADLAGNAFEMDTLHLSSKAMHVKVL